MPETTEELFSGRGIPKGWENFFEDIEVEKLLSRNLSYLKNRQKNIHPISIWPRNKNILDMFYIMKPQEIRAILILPRAYAFDSLTGIPVMIKNRERRLTSSVNNILKVFKTATASNFDPVWQRGVFLLNISLTEEEDHPRKIKHETMWSLFMEKLFIYLSNYKYRESKCFIFTGTAGIRQREFVDISTGHNEVIEIPAITNEEFPTKLSKILF